MNVLNTGTFALVIALVMSGTALAQRDMSGEWRALYHEDQPHRIPGPELGDYTGLPINDAAPKQLIRSIRSG